MKKDYINEINIFFREARNHGNNGSSWWYPVENRIAYNVKMYSFGDVATLRKSMTERQNDFYSDDELSGRIWQVIEDEGDMLKDEIKDTYNLVTDCNFAGRSGGWLEVTYQNDLIEIDEDTDKKDIDYYYKLAKELEKQEVAVSELIKERHKALNNYIDTPEYYKDLAENSLYSDEVIAECYKEKIKNLTDKLN